MQIPDGGKSILLSKVETSHVHVHRRRLAWNRAHPLSRSLLSQRRVCFAEPESSLNHACRQAPVVSAECLRSGAAGREHLFGTNHVEDRHIFPKEQDCLYFGSGMLGC